MPDPVKHCCGIEDKVAEGCATDRTVHPSCLTPVSLPAAPRLQSLPPSDQLVELALLVMIFHLIIID